MTATTVRIIPERPMRPADRLVSSGFATWVVIGLFVDGWAHAADKPESFWTPWHAVLYSGFLTGMVWFGISELRDRRRGEARSPDPLVLAGFGLFAAGGLVDMIWHTLFGVEADLAALMSPSHLTLMFAGLLLTTGPVRAVMADNDPAPSFAAFTPVAIGLTLTVAVLAFFLQFDSALRVFDDDVFGAGAGEMAQVHGVVGVLLANLLLVGALLWTLRNWVRPPQGTFALVFGGTGLLMAGLSAFDHVALVLPLVATGALADALVARGVRRLAIATVVPVVLWATWFATYHALWGLGWPVELWTGAIVFAALTGVGLSLLASPAPDPAARR